MATATAVLTTGAIPVIVDIDESITIDPDAVEAAIGPRTKAIVPVHMWGAAATWMRSWRSPGATTSGDRGRLPGRRRRL